MSQISQTAQNDLRAGSLSVSGPTVLILDSNIDEYRPWAEEQDATVLFSRSMPEAVHILKNSPVDACIVNLSIHGEQSGAVIRNLHDLMPGLNLVAIADDYEIHLEQIAWSEGATAFVAKPEHLNWLVRWAVDFQQQKQSFGFSHSL